MLLAILLVLHGAKVYTADRARPWAEALVIQDGRIAFVGGDAGALAFAGPKARSIDLRGRMVLPGFHDSHLHPMTGAMRLLRCRLEESHTPQDIYTAVHMCAGAGVPGKWLLGNGWSPQVLKPTLQKLDELVPDRPALLTTEDGFTGWVNTRALTIAGVDAPSGIVKDAQLEQIKRHVPRPSEAQYREALKRSTAIANQFGITSLVDASADAAVLEAYRAADRAGELTVRVVAAQRIDPRRGSEQIDELLKERDRSRGRRLRADAAKFFLDGEIDQHTAAMLEPYAGAPTERGPQIPQQALNALVLRLDAEGFLIHMHAMGDRAVRAGLDAIEEAIRLNGPRDRRHQLAHIGVASPDDIQRFGRLGVAANFQPLWMQPSDEAWAPTRAALGPERIPWMYPMASIAEHGGRILASSDWPAPSMNPLDAIAVATKYLSLEQVLAAYTSNAAWAARGDGTLEVGKVADLVVLDRNLFEAGPQARVLLTLLDGEPVYKAPGFDWP
jgi:predicted amidohydrolase YtcJ